MRAIQKQPGFTVVELLIVILVIAILAAISIAMYTGVQQRVRDSQRLSDINQISKAMQLWSTDASKPFQEMNTGFNNIPATGWYSASYGGDSSVKTRLVASGYIKDTIEDPLLSVESGRGYMLTRCTASTTDPRRVVFARLEKVPTQSVIDKLSSAGCADIYINAFAASPYFMNHALIVAGS